MKEFKKGVIHAIKIMGGYYNDKAISDSEKRIVLNCIEEIIDKTDDIDYDIYNLKIDIDDGETEEEE